MSSNLERRYRRVLRLLPGWYRQQWEQDMVAAFLDSWLTGDPVADEYIGAAAGPGWAETVSVAGLAVRLYLGGAGAPRRYFAWGQATRNAVLVVLLMHAVVALDVFVLTGWSHRLFGLHAPPASLLATSPGGLWPAFFFLANFAWMAVFVTLAYGQYRIAQVIAVLAIVPDLVALVRAQVTDTTQAPFGSFAFWLLLSVAPVVAMAAFHRDAPPPDRRHWLLALPAGYVLVYVPLLALHATGYSAWVPDFPGLCCILVSFACLVRTPWIRSHRNAESGVWSLTLALLAGVAGVYRIASLVDYLHSDAHMVTVSLAELLILLVAVGLVAPDAARAQKATPAPPPHPRAISA